MNDRQEGKRNAKKVLAKQVYQQKKGEGTIL